MDTRNTYLGYFKREETKLKDEEKLRMEKVRSHTTLSSRTTSCTTRVSVLIRRNGLERSQRK